MSLFGRARSRGHRRDDRDWVRCPGCAEILPARDVERQAGVCPACGYHHRRPVARRLDELCDAGTFAERDQRLTTTDLLRFRGERKYKDQLAEARKRSGADEAVRSGVARLDGREVALAVVETDFLAGSLGCVAAERLAQTFERAHRRRIPALVVASGGAARHAEGVLGQSQIARLADRRAALYSASVPFVAILVPPLPEAGLLALATSADVVLAEPAHPSGGVSARALLEAGLVDRIVAREALKPEVSALLGLLLPD